MYINHNQIVNLCDNITAGPIEKKFKRNQKIKKSKSSTFNNQ